MIIIAYIPPVNWSKYKKIDREIEIIQEGKEEEREREIMASLGSSSSNNNGSNSNRKQQTSLTQINRKSSGEGEKGNDLQKKNN